MRLSRGVGNVLSSREDLCCAYALALSLLVCVLTAPPGLAQEQFRRGDANADGVVDLADVVFIRNWLFLGSVAPTCLDAADADDQDGPNFGDEHVIFEFLYASGPPPADPGPTTPDPDPTDNDGIPCADYSPSQPPPLAELSLGFEVPASVLPGAPFQVFATLTTENNTTPLGPEGWAFSIRAEGLRVTAVTVEGTAGAPSIGGLERSAPADPLLDAGSGPQGEGAVSALILHLVSSVTLPATGTERIAAITVEPDAAPGEIRVGRLEFVDGLQFGAAGAPEGLPVRNLVVMDGTRQTPSLDSWEIILNDCNGNDIADDADILAGTSADCNANGIPDECEPDCNSNSVADACDLRDGASLDCNGNDVPDECDIADGTSLDCNTNAVPDECDLEDGTITDCNANGIPDDCDIADGTSTDCNTNALPDECDIADGASLDCNTNDLPDECDIADGTSPDCNADGIPDPCEEPRIVAELEAPPAGVTDAEVLLTVRLTTPTGDALPDPGIVPFTVSVTGSAAFGAAETGAITVQPDPGTIEVESIGGVFAVWLGDATEESVMVELTDSSCLGVRLAEGATFDFETGAGEWTQEVLVGPEYTSPWSLSTSRATSGTTSWWSGPASIGSGDAVLVSPEIQLRGTEVWRLEFRHWYSYDTCGADDFFADGGLVEGRVVPEGAWEALEPIGGYPAVLFPPCLNPLGERPAYSSSTAGEFQEATFSLAALSGERIQVRFHVGWDCGNCTQTEGWYVDDVRFVGGQSRSIQFLDPAADADGDGLTNAEEAAIGTNLLDADTDHDGLLDSVETDTGIYVDAGNTGTDPLDADTDDDGLLDSVETNSGTFVDAGNTGTDPFDADTDDDGLLDGVETGTGELVDASDTGSDPLEADTDGDTLLDGDEVIAGLDPNRSDTDGDGLPDDSDPFGRSGIRVQLEAPYAGVTTGPAAITCRLVDDAEAEIPDQLRFTLEASGSATFAASAIVGTVISGGGTSSVELETEGGLVTIEISDPAPELVQFTAVDSAPLGIRLPFDPLIFDFEDSSGGFNREGTLGALWQWGSPTSGPRSAVSGVRVWATNISGNYVDNADARLVSPEIPLPVGSEPELGFFHYYSGECCCDYARVEISVDGEPFTILPGIAGNAGTSRFYCDATGGIYVEVTADLEAFVGHTVRLGFRLTTDGSATGPGWYVDDVSIRDTATLPGLLFLDPDGDEDSDGVTNGDEFARGLNPLEEDTDDDGLLDGVETGTGIFVDTSDTGTDPLDPDTDGDGLEDGDELAAGTDPHGTDSDGDGVPDGEEVARDLDPADPDSDDDGLSDGVETDTGVFVDAGDTGTDPLDPDTDGDGLPDGAETNTGIFASALDAGTDPFAPDTDGGGRWDGSEVARGLDPLDPSDDGIIEVLAWTGSVGSGEYANVRSILGREIPGEFAITETTDTDPALLAPLLAGKDVFLVPEQEMPGSFEPWLGGLDQGEAFAIVLQDFVAGGGVVVGLSRAAGDLLRGAELLDARPYDYFVGAPLRVTAPDHLLMAGVSAPFNAPDATNVWLLRDPEAEVLVERESDQAPVVVAATGEQGAVFLIGFDYFAGFHEAANGILANAIAESYRFRDTDGDGIPDKIEVQLGLDPQNGDDGDDDLDGDGLSNSEEYEAGTFLRIADSDADGLTDREEVEDTLTDPLSPDTDGDGLLDPVDPFGRSIVRVDIEKPYASVVDAPAPITCRLLDDGGALIPESLRFTLNLSGSATFAAQATVGAVISGGGTSSVVLETAGGVVEIEVSNPVAELVEIESIDSESIGFAPPFVEGPRDILFDFEADDGQFTHEGANDPWQWGAPSPVVGPGGAVSGARLWATNLAGTYPDSANASLLSPSLPLPAGSSPELRFWHYYSGECCCDYVWVEVSVDGGPFSDLPGIAGNAFANRFYCNATGGGYQEISADLSAYDGHDITLSFRLFSDGSVTGPGWYLDDIRVTGISLPTLAFVEGGGDEDGDGLTNEDEIEGGTDPLSDDTDGDGLSDTVETGTGIFVSSSDTGTDPTNPDTDGDGLPDNAEVTGATDPHGADSDGDGLRDGAETRTGVFVSSDDAGTDPLSPDTDQDGRLDGDEVAAGLDPTSHDSDGDGLSDGVETDTGEFVDLTDTGTDPLSRDTDGGGRNDQGELALGLDPFDPADDGAPRVLAWTRFNDPGHEYPNTLAAIRRFFEDFTLEETETREPAALESALVDKDVFLVPELELPGSASPWPSGFEQGEAFATVLADFVASGGVVVALSRAAGDVVRGAGLLEVSASGFFGAGRPLGLVAPDHILAEGLVPPVTTQNATNGWALTDPSDPDTTVVLQQGTQPVVVSHSGGTGAVFLIGFDYFAFDDNAARILANAVRESVRFRDTDGDRIPDRIEEMLGLDPNNTADGAEDLDGDGLTNADEFELGTSLTVADSDGDGLSDGTEVARGLDPLDSDSDDDGAPDGTDPLPFVVVRATLTGNTLALVGSAVTVRAELRDPEDQLVAGTALRFSLTATPDAAFAADPEEGVVVSGAGTDRVLLETTTGVVALGVTPSTAGELQVRIEDSEGHGVSATGEALYRINSGGPAYTDVEGVSWRADAFYLSGSAASFSGVEIENTPDPTVYRTERWADAFGGERLGYSCPVEPGQYTVRLHFAEVFTGTEPPNPPRVFNVDIQGERVLTDFNTIDDLGGWRVAGVRSFRVDVAERERNLDILMSGGSYGHINPKVSAIEIISEERSAPHVVEVLAPDADEDDDRSTNLAELGRGTDVHDPDTDGDGLLDGVESASGSFSSLLDTGTDPLAADSDDDGLPDGLEAILGTSPLDEASRYPELSDGATLTGRRLEVGLAPDHSLINTSGRGILLLEDRVPTGAGDVLPPSGSHELSALTYLDPAGPVVVTRVTGTVGALMQVRGFSVDDPDGHAVIGVGDASPLWVRQEVRLGSDDRFVRFDLTISNLGPRDVQNVRYLRNADPTIDSRSNTWNDVIGDTVAVATGLSSTSLVLGTSDLRATASCEGQRVVNPDLVIATPVDPDDTLGDVALNLAFSLGDIAVGESVSLSFNYAAGETPEQALIAYLWGFDTDEDGLPDGFEVENGLSPDDASDAEADADGDGLTNREEFELGTALYLADTDGDGVVDIDERDGGSDPLVGDEDADGLLHGDEARFLHTDARRYDSDGDSFGDGFEFFFGGDPLGIGVGPAVPPGEDFEGISEITDLEDWTATGQSALENGRVFLPAGDVVGRGALFRAERVDGEYLYAAFDLEVTPGASGLADGVALALVGSPSPPTPPGGCCGGLGVAGLAYPTLVAEVDLRSEPGDPLVIHAGAGYFPDGVPAVEGQSLPSFATAPLPVFLHAGGTIRVVVEVAGGTLRIFLGSAGGGASEQLPVLEAAIPSYEPISGFAGVIASRSDADLGTLAIDRILVLERGPVSVGGVSPAFGPLAGGTEVVVVGAGFGDAPRVFFGSEEAAVASSTETEIVVTTPPGVGVGPETVYVQAQQGGAILRNGYTYTPYVRAVTPETGPVQGGTRVLVLGSGFVGSPPEVSFGAAEATGVDVVSDGIAEVRVPAGTLGPVDVHVRQDDVTSSLRRGFLYVPALFVPDDAATLQEAIDLADPDTLVIAAAAEYPESIVIGKDIEIRSLSGPQDATISGGDLGGPTVRVLRGKELTLRGFTVTGGHDFLGSGILCETASSLTLSDVDVRDNDGPAGRGITFFDYTRFALDRVVVSGNRTSGGAGGGILLSAHSAGTISNTVIAGNSATGNGGGLGFTMLPVGKLRMAHVTVVDNESGGDGGGVQLPPQGDVLLVNSVLWGNKARSLSNDLDGGTVAMVESCNLRLNPFGPVNGNFSRNPEFSDPSVGDYSPKVGSPLVDAGGAAGVAGLDLDVLRLARVTDGNGDGVALPDVGAFELNDFGGRQIPGDCTQDGELDVSDGVCILQHLYLGDPEFLPCGDGLTDHPANLALFDWQPDGGIDISDGVGLLQFVYVGGLPHPLAIPENELKGCVPIPDCPDLGLCE